MIDMTQEFVLEKFQEVLDEIYDSGFGPTRDWKQIFKEKLNGGD